jgi:para-nitrobenzyl esterase
VLSFSLRYFLFVIVGGAQLLGGCASTNWNSTAPEVTIDTGQLRGADIDDVRSFKGIPFAAPPLGELRWVPPQPAADWTGVRSATEYAPHCAQIDPGLLWFELDEYSEDCLALNVWSPAPEQSAKLPVMVWIHGGGYSNGSGNIARLNSPAFARQGVVLVTLNYRLSVFGFLNHPALAASNPDMPAGNYGLLDVVAGLEWVQRNIAAFGGDPDNVTIFGESAGAGLVNTLLVTPASKGLFQRAISESASVGLAPDPYPAKRAGFLPPANKLGEKYLKKLGIADYKSASPTVAAALRAMTTEQLLGVLKIEDRYTPVVDGITLPDQVGAMTAAGKQHRVPYITGGNNWEASLGREIGGGFSPEFAARLVTQEDKDRFYPGLSGAELADQIFGDLIVLSGSRYTANQMVKIGAPVYSYYLTYVASARRKSQPGAAHTDDIAFVLQTLDNEADLSVISDKDREISALMSAYWVQFAKTGNPNLDGLPEWPVYDSIDGQILEIGDAITVQDGLLQERMEFHMARGSALMEKTRK